MNTNSQSPESSNDEDEVFTDAPDKPTSPPLSPVPITRVEKVDDNPSHGEVPGTNAYKIRTKDAVPDEIEVIPEGSSRSSSRRNSGTPQPRSPGGTPIPKTVVEKVEPSVPSHGEIPGTAAHAVRRADAKPDAIITSSDASKPFEKAPPSPIPRTVVTRVDSLPAHGEVPGTDAFNKRTEDADPDVIETKRDPSKHNSDAGLSSDRLTEPDLPTSTLNSSSSHLLAQTLPVSGRSPIAADGGFGSMDFEGVSDDDSDDSEPGYRDKISIEKAEAESQEATNDDTDDDDDGFGDDFDDFEEGEKGDDFDNFDDGFDDGFQEPEEVSEPIPPPKSTISSISPPFVSRDSILHMNTLPNPPYRLEIINMHI